MQKRSFVGTYAGFSAPEANGYVRTSEYVTVSDGTMIAVDILHPALDGEALGGPRPTVVRATGYRRSFVWQGAEDAYDIGRIKILRHYPHGTLITPYELAPTCKPLVDHGYNLVSIDFRGTGASFGQNSNYSMGRDLAEIIDWIAEQPWSNGKTGMWGRSWEALCQMLTAANTPKHLTCLAPAALTTGRNALWYNGVFSDGFTKGWSLMRQNQDNAEPAAPVDGPDGERLRDEARAQSEARYANTAVSENVAETMSEYVDVEAARTAQITPNPDDALPMLERFDAINKTGAAIYIHGGWWDMHFPNDQLAMFKALTVPKKILTGPWTHSQFEFSDELLRWFDYWLKGVDNGIMDEPAIHYATTDVKGNKAWYGAQDWPLVETEPTTLFAASDGLLSETAPTGSSLPHEVDHTISNGPSCRTTYMFNTLRLNYTELNERAGRCLSFTTAPLDRDIDITGIPSVHFGITSDQSDLSVMVTLEQIDENGDAYYLTEGILNLKHRKSVTAPVPHVEEHYHSEKEPDSLPLVPGQQVTVDLDMFALSVRVAAGHRLRVALAFADTDNYAMPSYDPPANVKLALGEEDGFRISLSITDPETKPGLVAEAFQTDVPDYAFTLKD